MSFSRRSFLKRLGVTGFTAGMFAGQIRAQETCQRVNGSGSYALGPFEPLDVDADPVFLITDLGFDETMLFCKVTTNFAPFRFPTARLGVIEFGAHEFYMDMQSESIEALTIEQGNDGLVANFTGVLRSETRVFSGARLRTYTEDHIAFGCLASQLSPAARIEISKSNFSMTARFDPNGEHAAIFGDQATFAGRLSQGNIIVNA